MKEENKPYSKINDDQVIFKASFTKRLVARILDFSFALFIPIVISIIYFEIGINKSNQWYPQPWNWSFLLTGILSMVGIFVIMVIIPAFNKKTPGQTIGKKILGIKILNINKKNIKKKIFLREVPMSFFYMIPIALQLISGLEINHLLLIYSKQNEEYKKGIFDFLFNVIPNGIDGVKNMYMWQSILNLISMILKKIEIFIFIGISISILASPQNISINDKYLGLGVVNISSIKKIEDIEEEDENE